MKRLIIVAVLVLLAGLVVWRYTFRNSSSSVGSEKPEYQIMAEDLYEKFVENEIEANHLFLNKVIRVEGIVGSVEPAENGFNISLRVDDESSGVICNFNPDVSDIKDFEKGNRVTIQGLCTGYLFDVVLVKCDLIK